MIEIWKPVDSYPYEVSNLGRVRRIGNSEPIAQTVVKKRNGIYLKVDLWRWGKRKTARVHRLVAQVFLPPPALLQHEVNHRDLNTLNNNAENLEWASRHENEAYKRFWKAHRQLAGERVYLT